MVSDFLYVHIPRFFGCTLRGLKNPKFHVYEKDAHHKLDSGGPNLVPRSLFSSGVVTKNDVFFDAPNWVRHFFLRTTVSLERKPSYTVLHFLSVMFYANSLIVFCCFQARDLSHWLRRVNSWEVDIFQCPELRCCIITDMNWFREFRWPALWGKYVVEEICRQPKHRWL